MKNVAVLAGGFSAEENISLQSGEVVYNSLKDSKYRPFQVIVRKDGWTVAGQAVDKSDFSVKIDGEHIRFDAAFIAIHGDPGENGRLQAYLEMLEVPHTTCGTLAAAITFNKATCKELIITRGTDAQLAPGILVNQFNREAAIEEIKTLELPVFVKPNQNGSSYGINKINEWAALKPALDEGFQYDSELLVEQGVNGVEVTCGLYEKKGKLEALPLCEIVSEHDFFNYTAKYTSGEADEIIPARISPSATKKCREISRKLYRSLGLSGLVRIDYIFKGDAFYFLEVNTVPGLSEASIVPRMVQATGEPLSAFFEGLIDEAIG